MITNFWTYFEQSWYQTLLHGLNNRLKNSSSIYTNPAKINDLTYKKKKKKKKRDTKEETKITEANMWITEESSLNWK